MKTKTLKAIKLQEDENMAANEISTMRKISQVWDANKKSELSL